MFGSFFAGAHAVRRGTVVLVVALIASLLAVLPGGSVAQAAPTTSYNHAFVGFVVPSGRHRAVLRYMPGSFVWGAGVSLASLVVGLFLLGRSRRRAAPSPSTQHERYLARRSRSEEEQTAERDRVPDGVGLGADVELRDQVPPAKELPP